MEAEDFMGRNHFVSLETIRFCFQVNKIHATGSGVVDCPSHVFEIVREKWPKDLDANAPTGSAAGRGVFSQAAARAPALEIISQQAIKVADHAFENRRAHGSELIVIYCHSNKRS